MELINHGNLQDYLQGDGRNLKLTQLINMGVQIAPGMAYLERHYFIHGNLAAKSVLYQKILFVG